MSAGLSGMQFYIPDDRLGFSFVGPVAQLVRAADS
jgi:hypothetical protein